ncbi:RNA polymerase sigma factor [Haliangium ochraceum]|uniref:RNA polymerase, sigma-24 subunit, ECF subfamily n=1 Tax=Haliangium ochraceum (strain DSM 14365 / JCM 11303 / SMP-2) TaxID=502025 RepID=D0LUP1_HALO1|nr:sigma-70 family RNA polymerase sigma factor [Haliangium ochraceum]ACY13931.1 RNA polymerase, sigma-24 subunit, ECF subfamily [Haliangium ochraceum DSM 14365]
MSVNDRKTPPAPPPPPPAPESPPDPETRPPSLGERVALSLALLLVGGGVVLPGAVLGWMVAAALASGVTAEALERTNGLEPTTFGGGYWIAVGVNLAVLLWSAARRLLRRPQPWKPLAVLSAGYLLLLLGAVAPDAAGAVDVPDVLTTAALLGGDALVRYVVPWLLLLLAVRGGLHLQRLGRRSSAAAQRVGVTSACLGLTGVMLVVAAAAAELEGETVREAPRELGLSLDLSDAAGKRRSYQRLSEADGSSTRALEDGFGTCAESLSQRRQSKRPVLEQATEQLVRGGLPSADAQDLVMDTMIKVCEKHAESPRQDLAQYFWGALRNNVKKAWRRMGRERGGYGYDDEPLDPERELSAYEKLALRSELQALRAAWAELASEDREVLRLRHIDGLRYAEVAARMGIGEASARQRAARARARLKRAWQRQMQSR